MGVNLYILIFVLFTVGVNGQSAAEDDVALQTGICRQCICKDQKVDCFDQNFTTFFGKEEWEALKTFKPIEVDLSENLFRNVTALAELPIQVLNLSRCNIEEIADASFMGLQDMRVLDLSYNQLTSAKLSPHSFEVPYSTNGQRLNCSDAVETLPTICSIDSGNAQWEHLNLKTSLGKYSPEQYEPLKSMRVLNLAHNDIHSLNQDMFEHLPKLEELDLSGNPIQMIDHVTVVAITSLPWLKVLRMRSCKLSEIPERFLHTLIYLERLDLSDNSLTAIPQELVEAKNLMFLNLNQNPIVKLDVTNEDYPGFPRLRKLKELHMCNMPLLRSIGVGALAGLESLESLHMSFNPSLSSIHPKALARPDEIGETYDWPIVKELYLQSNNLTEIDSRLLSRWDLLTKVDVSDNPFVCDCTTQWMVDVLVPTIESKGANASLMNCQEPIEMRDHTFKQLHDYHRKMRCLDKYGHRPERDGSILLGTLIGVLLAVPIILGLMLMWRRGYFAWLGLRPPQDVSRAFYKRAPADDQFI